MSTVQDGFYFTSYEDPILPSQTEQIWLAFSNPNKSAGHIDIEGDDIGDGILSGKWLLYRTQEQIDALWPELKDALQANRLGTNMKASTPANPGPGPICIYTKSWRDTADIRRVLAELRKLGISDRIYYKADAQTFLGVSGSVYGSPLDTQLEITPKGREWYQKMGRPIPGEF